MTELAFCRKRKNITQDDLGKILGVPKSSVSAWENGVRQIPVKHYTQIMKALGLTEAEFRQALPPVNDVRPPTGTGMEVPLITSAAAATCNPGIVPLLECVTQYSEEKIFFKQAREGDFAIEVSGTSMSPWYPEGTLLLVRPYQDLRNGQRVVVVLDEGEIIFKIYAEKGDKICLFSISGDGKDYVFTKPRVPIRYICRVVASIRNEDDLDAEMQHQNLVHDWQVKLNGI